MVKLDAKTIAIDLLIIMRDYLQRNIATFPEEQLLPMLGALTAAALITEARYLSGDGIPTPGLAEERVRSVRKAMDEELERAMMHTVMQAVLVAPPENNNKDC